MPNFKKKSSKCKSCDKEILWVAMESNKNMPVDYDSIKQQIVISSDHWKGAIRFVGRSHFETCPDSVKFREKNK